MVGPIDQERLLRILASVSASYTRRELDRRVYDQLMASPVGQSLKQLSVTNKYALEFVTYFVSAVAAERVGQPGPLGEYLKQVLTDAPSEIAKRMINGVSPEQFDESDVSHVANAMSQENFEQLLRSSATWHQHRDSATDSGNAEVRSKAETPANIASALGAAAEYVDSLRARIRKDD